MYEPFAVNNEEDYQKALALVEPLIELDPKEGTEEFFFLDVMATLVEAYEAVHYPLSLVEEKNNDQNERN